MNRVALVGHLTRDPQLRHTNAGTPVAELGVAINEKFKNRDGQTSERTSFVDVIVWARQAETCAEFLCKGAPVLVEGKLQQDRWEADDGQTRSKLRVRAVRVQFLSKRSLDSHAESPAQDNTTAPSISHDNDNLPF
jgi:single-strand DNA-binding protein